MAEESLTFSGLCQACGKSAVDVRTLQATLGLTLPSKDSRYGGAYARFLKTVIALRTFAVPLDVIADLLVRERQVLRLLKMDALSDSPTWFLDQRLAKGHKERRLLLTGYDVGFPLDGKVIQPHLDFGTRARELFSGQDMGEDVRRALDGYLRQAAKIKARVVEERTLLIAALEWAADTLAVESGKG